MKQFRFFTTIGAALFLLFAWSVPSTLAQAVPGGTLDPTTIPKYGQPLVLPPVLYDDKGGSEPLDDVEVSLRQIEQQVLPPGFPKTPLWAYGDPNNLSTFFNPGFTIEVTKDTISRVKWINGLVNGEGDFLPHIIRDTNGIPIVDQTLHWANPAQDPCAMGEPRTDCRGTSDEPYYGPVPMVIHVHGAHVGPGSDGYPEAWWLPAADNIPANYATNGRFFESADGAATAMGQGYAIDEYTNDQPTAPLWYHDHTLGMTRLNVYAAGAGFWMIRTPDDGDTGLIRGRLPGPAPRYGDTLAALNTPGDPVRNAIRELPIAIQPKSFNADGSQYYPADRAFFEGLSPGESFGANPDLNIPFIPEEGSDIAPVWNPEAFFNTMVVNGRTWPIMEVAPERYRLRFINASDSRFMNVSMFKISRFRYNQFGQIRKLREVPFYQIGSEQGLLPKVVHTKIGFSTPLPGDGRDVAPNWVIRLVERFPKLKPTYLKRFVFPEPAKYAEQALLMGPAERPDVIVDFSRSNGFFHGDLIVLFNTAPDAPFGGFPDVPADPGTTGQIMMFKINKNLKLWIVQSL